MNVDVIGIIRKIKLIYFCIKINKMMNIKHFSLTLLVLFISCQGLLRAQSFTELYDDKIAHLDQVASLEVFKYYNAEEKRLLVQAIDEGRTWLDSKIDKKITVVLEHSLLTENQASNLRMENNEYNVLKNQLEQYLAESPAFALGTGYTKSQWNRMHRAAKLQLAKGRELYLYLHSLHKTLNEKAAEIAAAKRKNEKADAENNEHAKIDRGTQILPDGDDSRANETELYKYSTFGLLFGIGMWLFFRYKDNV
jgi:hypothetical protein